MQNLFKILEKYTPLILAAATAYFAVIAIMGDIFYWILPSALFFLVRIIYLAVGLVGVLELIKMFKPDLYKKIIDAGNKKTPTSKK